MGKMKIKTGNNYNEEDMRGRSCSGVHLRSTGSLMKDNSIFLRIRGLKAALLHVDLLSG